MTQRNNKNMTLAINIERIIIIGGGIAGLSSAIALVRDFPPTEVIIIERSPKICDCDQGFGMLLLNNGVQALHDLGAEKLLHSCQPIRQSLIRQPDGKVIFEEKFDSNEEIFCCSRQHILTGLESALAALDDVCDKEVARISKKCQYIGLSSDNFVTEINFQDGTTLEVSPHDLVVGADGARSVLCSTLNPNLERPISQVNEVVSSTYSPELAQRIGHTFHKMVCRSAGLGYGLLAPTPTQAIGFIQFDTSKHNIPRSKQEKKSLFDLAVSMIKDPVQRELFEDYARIVNLDDTASHVWKPINSELPAKLHAKNAVLVGDAAHPLLPFTSQGTSLALEDSVVLAQTLKPISEWSSLDAALGHFVEQRRLIAEEFHKGGQEILREFLNVEQSISLAPYCTKAEPVPFDAGAMFSAEKVDFSQLSSKAYNYRWATLDSDVIPLTAADSDFAIAEPIQDAMHNYVSQGYMNYGPAKGLPKLRGALASKYSVSSEQVFITNAAASSMFLVMQHLLTEPGDEVIIADPIDFLFQRAVQAAGGVVRRYILQAPHSDEPTSHWSFDIGEVEALITDRTKVIGICNPHNPVGRVWSSDELQELADLAIRNDLKIWSDEVWSDISYVDFVPTLALGPEVAARTYTVLGFSKGYGLAGLRLGAILAPTAGDINAISQVSLAEDTGYGVSVLSQVAGVAALEEAGQWQEAFRNHVHAQCMRAVSALNRIPFVHATMPQGTFVVLANVSHYLTHTGMDEEELVEFLKSNAKVAVVPGSPKFFGPSAAGHVRLSVATSAEVLAKALQRIGWGLKNILIEHGEEKKLC